MLTEGGSRSWGNYVTGYDALWEQMAMSAICFPAVQQSVTITTTIRHTTEGRDTAAFAM